MSGYSFKVIRGADTRFVADGQDPQDVIDEDFG